MSSQRDDFPISIKKVLSARVAYKCSRPDCSRPTVGPSADGPDIVNLGVAAHITAAALGGPRFDGRLTSTARSSLSNGIWLCQNCAKLIDSDASAFPVEVLQKWKAAAELRARRELDGRLSRPADGLDTGGFDFRSVMEVSRSPEAVAISLALFDDSNPHATRNRIITETKAEFGQDLRSYPVCHLGLRAIVEDLLADLASFVQCGHGAYRFLTTNTSIERIGQAVWTDDNAFRTLVARTESLLASSPSSLDFWRVFVLRDPAGIVARNEGEAFLAVLNENLTIGAKVAIASARVFPSSMTLAFSDFYCVPGRLAYVNVVPNFLAARFDMTREQDRLVVRCYSEIAESLVQRASAKADETAFTWPGGNLTELEELLAQLRPWEPTYPVIDGTLPLTETGGSSSSRQH